MEATASARYLRGSAQKARLVVDMIRGKDVNQALAILRFSKKRAAESIEKCMRSAIANANEAAEKANVSIDPDELWVRTAFVDRGPTKNRRRVRPAPQGRARNARRRRKSRKPLPKSRQRRRLRRRKLRAKSKNWRRLWVKKFIHTVFGSATTKTGTRTGLPSDSSASSCLKI